MHWLGDADRLVEHAQLVVGAPVALGAITMALAVGMVLSRRVDITLLMARWAPTFTLSLLFLVINGVAAWCIGRRQAVGGYVAIGLFAYRIGFAMWHGHVLSVTVAYAVLGIWLVLRAAAPLGMRLPLRTP